METRAVSFRAKASSLHGPSLARLWAFMASYARLSAASATMRKASLCQWYSRLGLGAESSRLSSH